MTPVTQAAVSLFGAPLDASSVSATAPEAVNPTANPMLPGAWDAALASGIAAAPFADLMTEAVGQVGKLEQRARLTVRGLMSGTGVDVHEAMIATEKADMGFELMLALRNKALAAYQQVMGMQF